MTNCTIATFCNTLQTCTNVRRHCGQLKYRYCLCFCCWRGRRTATLRQLLSFLPSWKNCSGSSAE